MAHIAWVERCEANGGTPARGDFPLFPTGAIMNKRTITVSKKRTGDIPAGADCFVPGSVAERLAYVWELTREAAALGGNYDAEQRLQRHVTCLIRRKG